MAKEIISASVETETISDVKKLAEKESRSFSQMVDLLLQDAIKLKKEKEDAV